MYDDDDFLISYEDIARLRAKKASKQKQLDEDDQEMLRLLASLDNGSSDDQDWEYTDWDDVVKQFLSTYKVSRSDWNKILEQVKKLKQVQPSKTFTCDDLVAIGRDVKEKERIHHDKEEMD